MQNTVEAEILFAAVLRQCEAIGTPGEMRPIRELDVKEEVEPPSVVTVGIDSESDVAALKHLLVACVLNGKSKWPRIAVVIEVSKVIRDARCDNVVGIVNGNRHVGVIVFVFVVRVKFDVAVGEYCHGYLIVLWFVGVLHEQGGWLKRTVDNL
jgi:hypothetical protein